MKSSRLGLSSLLAVAAMAGLGSGVATGSEGGPVFTKPAPPPRKSAGRPRQGRRNTATDWLRNAPHGGGAREVARRQRQLAAGTLRTN